MAKSVKWCCFVLILSGAVSSYANVYKAAISVIVKPKPAPHHYNRLSVNSFKYKPLPFFSFGPPDITMNVCGTNTILNSSTVPGYSSSTLIWDNGTTATSRTITSSGTYWWQVTGTNVVANGDFSSGDTGFTSSYADKTPGPNGTNLFPEATYAVGTNPHAYHSSFSTFGDHTTGSGNMLIVNGASTPNVTVWHQNITIAANTDYVFSGWVTSATASNPAILQFSINGTPLGSAITPSASLADGVWQFFTATWNSGATSGSVPIALVNQNTAASGNDFAIDDIVFAPVYRQNIIVNLNPVPVLAVTSPAAQCGGTYDLKNAITGYNATTYTYAYQNGATTLGSSIVSASGTYTITETNNTTNCVSAPQNVTVTINPVPVLAVTSPAAQCGGTYDLKNAITGYNATTYTYTYQNRATTLGSSVVSASGTYTITETNNTTNCVSAPQSVIVTINPVPVLAVTSPHTVCATYDLTTGITGYDPTTYTYTFKDLSNNVLTLAAAQAITQSGTYTIIETNNTTGCQSLPQTTTVTIIPNPVKPGIASP